MLTKKAPRIPASRSVNTQADWVCIGADLSMSTCSLAAIARTTEGKIRISTAAIRWSKGTDYFSRLHDCASVPYTLLPDLWNDLKVLATPDKVFISYEEPVSYGHMKRGVGMFIKQQCQISGAFVGGLLTRHYPNLFEIQANQWRAMVAHDLGITTHKSKWSPPELAQEFHCHPNAVGKFRAKQWVKEFHPKWDGDWPDIISHGKEGQIPRPAESYAQGIQSDDRYEALAMAEFQRRLLKTEGN